MPKLFKCRKIFSLQKRTKKFQTNCVMGSQVVFHRHWQSPMAYGWSANAISLMKQQQLILRISAEIFWLFRLGFGFSQGLQNPRLVWSPSESIQCENLEIFQKSTLAGWRNLFCQTLRPSCCGKKFTNCKSQTRCPSCAHEQHSLRPFCRLLPAKRECSHCLFSADERLMILIIFFSPHTWSFVLFQANFPRKKLRKISAKLGFSTERFQISS